MNRQEFTSHRFSCILECLHHLSYADLSAKRMADAFVENDPLTAKHKTAIVELSGIVAALSARYPDFQETESYLRLKALIEDDRPA